MDVEEILKTLASLGNEKTRNMLHNHGARQPLFGVSTADLGKLARKLGTNHELALSLFETGNSDAMCLAGMIADPGRMTLAGLQRWAVKAYWYMLSEYTVASVASRSPFARALAADRIRNKKENIASSGWAVYSMLVMSEPDEKLDLKLLSDLLDDIAIHIHDAPGRVRYTMNGFVIACGISCIPLAEKARQIAQSIGKVRVDMGATSCKVPLASEYIRKAVEAGKSGRKNKAAK